MPLGDYYQDYGPIQRRRRSGELPRRSDGEKRTPGHERPPSPRRPRRLRRIAWGWVLLRVVTALLVIPIVLPYAVSLFYYERALPGVSVQGRPVHNLNQQEIATALSHHYASFLRQPVTLTYAEQSWQPTLAELGVTLDLDGTAAAALTPGRQGDPLTRLRHLWSLWRDGHDLSPQLVIDMRHLQNYLSHLSATVETPPQNASLSVAAGKVIGTPATPGVQLLAHETAVDLARSLGTLTPQQCPLRTRQLPPTIGNEALVEAQERARGFLDSTLILTHSAQASYWTWEPEQLATLLHIEPVDRQLRVDISRERLTREVERLAQLVDSGSVEPRLRFEDGRVHLVREGYTGWELQQPAAVQAISETLHQPHPATQTVVVLPVQEVFPHITQETLPDLGIVELVAEGKSSFAGSADYRITNIKAGAARLDGVLIAPDEEFSFNTQLGEVNAENGFVEGYAVVGNRTQLEWGGGVCQNSTTVFRAAFWAGLPITEHHPHPFIISWYDRFAYGPHEDGPGMDATIFTGVNDLKFVNDTGHWLLMQVEVDEYHQVLTVQLYGTRPDRQVALEGPVISNEVAAPRQPVYINDPTRPAGTVYQSDVARNGRDIMITRVIRRDGEELRRDPFFTRFRAWPNVFVRGTGTDDG
ncbi:MAG: vanomycin resistance protein VanB [Chloroflexaceae bacterium]|nr:vanomycin resistance protein VanB [Chloroflexaceae bacterium]